MVVWQGRNRALRRRFRRKGGKRCCTHARRAISEGGKGASERVQKGAIKADTGFAARAQIKEEKFSRDVWEGVNTRKPAAVAHQDRESRSLLEGIQPGRVWKGEGGSAVVERRV